MASDEGQPAQKREGHSTAVLENGFTTGCLVLRERLEGERERGGLTLQSTHKEYRGESAFHFTLVSRSTYVCRCSPVRRNGAESRKNASEGVFIRTSSSTFSAVAFAQQHYLVLVGSAACAKATRACLKPRHNGALSLTHSMK